MRNNPDFMFNMAMINQVVEDYQTAYDGYMQAYKLDPSLEQSRQQATAILNFAIEIASQIKSKGNIKKRQLEKALQIFPSATWPSGIQEKSLSFLCQPNSNISSVTALSVCIVKLVSEPSAFPLYVHAVILLNACFAELLFAMTRTVLLQLLASTMYKPLLLSQMTSFPYLNR